jgi:hypothetical protein
VASTAVGYDCEADGEIVEEPMKLRVEFDRETVRRWIAEMIDLPGVMAYGKTVKRLESVVS